ncbi:MAG: efflux RND transporter periplasmic adaptor subunit [Gammaproteobacteria bacterium]|jgi:RND family efflux transporter MFP subunit
MAGTHPGPAGAAPEPAAEPEVRALLVPVVETTLSSRMAGRISEISVKEGDRFTKGQLLVRFDCEIQESYLRKSRAKLLAARKTHESNLQLREYQSIGELDVELSAAEVQTALADVEVFRAKLNLCRIDAPFDGRVVELLAQPYESVAEHQPLLSILDDRNLEVQLYIPSWWLSWLKTGDSFTIAVDETGKSYPARVTRLGARVDAASQSLEITASIDGTHPELLAGMSGVARFDVPRDR